MADYQYPTGTGQTGANGTNGTNGTDAIIGATVKTGDYTLLSGDAATLFVMNSGGAHTFQLPGTVPANGWHVWLQNEGAGTCTVDRNGHNIDDAATNFTLTTGQGALVASNGTNYYTCRGMGSGSSGTLAGLGDVALSSPTTGQVLTYDSGTSKWINQAGGGGSGGGPDTYRRRGIIVAVPSSNPFALGDTFNHYSGGSSWNGYNNATATQGPSAEDQNAGGINTVYGFYGYASYRTGRNIAAMLTCAIPQTTTVRCFIGMVSSNSTAFCIDDPSGAGYSYACFRFSTTASDTHIQCVAGNGATQTVVDSGVVPDTNGHRFSINFNDTTGHITFYIDGALVGTITTNVPAAGINLLYSQQALCTTTTGAHIFFTAVEVQCDL